MQQLIENIQDIRIGTCVFEMVGSFTDIVPTLFDSCKRKWNKVSESNHFYMQLKFWKNGL